VSALLLQTDGKILVGGGFTNLAGQTRNYLARMKPDGTLDGVFNPEANDIVSALAEQADGKILVAGNFTALEGQPRNRIGRLNNTEPATQSLSYDGSTITWQRGGSSPEVWRCTFEQSTDGSTWTSVGNGLRMTAAGNSEAFCFHPARSFAHEVMSWADVTMGPAASWRHCCSQPRLQSLWGSPTLAWFPTSLAS